MPKRQYTEVVTCSFCGNPFDANVYKRYRFRQSQKVYCSPEHSNAGKSKSKIKQTLLERFLEHTKRLPNGCLECDLSRSQKGYPMMCIDGKMRPISHVAWFLHYGWWPPETHEADHMCHIPDLCAGGPDDPHRRCAEWSHLMLRIRHTGGNNSSERSNAGRAAAARAAAMKHFKCGHEITQENTYRYPRTGKRRCRECHRIQDGIRRAAKRQALAAVL